eukprot:4932229-Pleurochrysis_carterae.AAC.2
MHRAHTSWVGIAGGLRLSVGQIQGWVGFMGRCGNAPLTMTLTLIEVVIRASGARATAATSAAFLPLSCLLLLASDANGAIGLGSQGQAHIATTAKEQTLRAPRAQGKERAGKRKGESACQTKEATSLKQSAQLALQLPNESPQLPPETPAPLAAAPSCSAPSCSATPCVRKQTQRQAGRHPPKRIRPHKLDCSKLGKQH